MSSTTCADTSFIRDLGGAGDVVEVRDHPRRLVVELAQVLVERAELVLEAAPDGARPA